MPDPVRLNAPIQGTAAYGLKRALAPLWERRRECPVACPVLASHDEIMVESVADQAGAATRWLEKAMRDGMAPLLRPVPIEIAIRSSVSWGHAVEEA